MEETPCAPTLSDALALHEAGRRAEARALYRRVLAQVPADANAWHLLGVLHAEEGDHEAGEAFIRLALTIVEVPEFHYNRAMSLVARSRFDEAVAALDACVSLNPDHTDARFHLANLYRMQRRPNESIAAYRHAIAIRPDFAQAHANLGVILQEVGQPDLAIASFCAAIQHQPNHAEAHNNLGHALQMRGLLSQAAASFSVAIGIRPNFAAAWSNLGNVFKEQGQPDRAIAAYRTALSHSPGYAAAHSNLLMAQHYATECTNADILAAARDWGTRLVGPTEPRPFAAPLTPGRPLRIGYVSGDFNSHPVGYFLESVLGAHDRSRVTVVAYANNSRSDGLTDRLRARTDAWREIVGVGDDAVEDLVRRDGIDVLVDLSGHTAGNRLTLFARRPAPVQVTWLGYFGTTGLPGMDWILADHTVVPPGDERYFTESVRRLPNSYLCFTPPADDVPVAPPPLLACESVTFGCFSNRAKISPATVELWAHLLAALPRARLLLKARQFGDAGVRQALRDRFAAHGIAANRLRMEGESPRSEYLSAYGRIDAALDPTPFAGGTTTAESLWMGVPVVTLRGDRWAGRISASILATVGLADRLVANDPADYIAKAAALVADAAGLADLRASLRTRLLTSPLCDAPAFARALEDAYRSMVEAAASRPGG
ncbi:tetratricopeptide repeat protein [Azospirillum halopraeferens]|uniref:O-linked N-acetylglucosamine transferase, SPINDLY family protein n=1 Tax=Azospirillum halopraeferens TaxID=34010 RepID=UPI0003FED143|nr:glycosyltransferase family 41 protein [Azospirillum halopraeferens]